MKPVKPKVLTADSPFFEIVCLATDLAKRIRATQKLGKRVPYIQVKALSNAMLLLQEHTIPLPSYLTETLHEIDSTNHAIAEAGNEQNTVS